MEVKVYGYTLRRARCISSVLGNEENHKFISATCCLNSNNEIHLFEYSTEKEDFLNIQIFPHKEEIWDISTCPKDENLFFAVFNSEEEFKGNLYKIKKKEEGGGKLETLKTFESGKKFEFKGDLRSILWGSGKLNEVISVDTKEIAEWDLEKMKEKRKLFTSQRSIITGKVDPNFSNIIGIVEDKSIILIDKRGKNPAQTIKNAHEFGCKDMDFNPISFHQIVSGGEDCKMCFWDIRNLKDSSLPLKVVCAHSHWITKVKFNPLKDQLVLSASTDGLVKLWDISSVSSLKKKGKNLKDRLITKISSHEESIYSIAWSFDSWIFASVSFSGRLLICEISDNEKEKILLV